MTTYSNLSLKALADVNHFVVPEKHELSLDSPATEVITDFNIIEPQVIAEDMQVDKAIQFMQNSHFWMKLVLDKDTNDFIGIVLLRDLLSRRTMAKAIELSLDRDDLLVKHVMRPKASLSALCNYQLKEATIGDIVYTLKEHGEQYCLILDSESNHIRGIISSSEIRKKLGVRLNIEEKLQSFSSIFHYLSHRN